MVCPGAGEHPLQYNYTFWYSRRIPSRPACSLSYEQNIRQIGTVASVCEYPDGTKSLKLGDFGLATVVAGPLYTVCGTPTYVAPEIIAETGYGLKVDIWAAGVIAYILLCGFPPFRSENNVQEELFDQILRGNLEFPSPDWDAISLPAKMLISQMLQVNVDARFTAEEVLSHPWVTDEAPGDSATVSSAEDQEPESPVLETKQVPSPLV